MRIFFEDLREFKNIRKIEKSERPFLQIPLYLSLNVEGEEKKEEEIGSKVIIIDLLEGGCQIEL